MRAEGRGRRRILGLVMILILVALVAGVVAGYARVFSPVVTVTVRADRAGLLMNPGAAVSLRGVNVGEVRAVAADLDDGRHAVLQIALDPRQAERIPANVTAEIAAPTLFGAKYVRLDAPTNPSAERIQRGAVIHASSVSTETNDLLGNLHTLLTTVDVAKMSSALGGLSTSLQGRGDRIGELLASLNQYLLRLNPSVPTLTEDLASAADVTNTYADITPDLVRILDNLSVTSDTLVDEKEALPALLSSLIRAADDGRTLVDDNGDELEDLLSTLRPTSELLGYYSPMFPCLFASINQLNHDLRRIFGYQYAAIHTFSSFLPGSAGYRYPRDLPKVGVKVPPTCYGGPIRPADAPIPHVIFDDGWKGFLRSDAVTPGSLVGIPGLIPPGSGGPTSPVPVPDRLLGGLTAPARGGGR